MAKKPARVFRDSKGGAPAARLNVTQQVEEHPQAQDYKPQPSTVSDFDGLLESMYDALLITDTDGVISMINSRSEHCFTRTKQELLSMNIVDLISGATPKLLDLIRENVEKRTFTVLEGFCRRGDGSRFYAEIVVGRYKGRSQGGFCFFARDITGRKTAEIEQKKVDETHIAEERVRARIETLSTLYHEINNPLQILTCMAEIDENKEYSDQLGRIVDVIDKLRKEEEFDVIDDSEAGPRYDIGTEEALIQCDPNRILIVDDEEVLRKVFMTSLSGAFPDAQIEAAADGGAAVAMFSEHHYSLIIMDVSMPGMNGVAAFDEISTVCEDKGIELPRFIFCTGFVMSDRLRDVVGDESVHTCIRKPLSIGDLAEVVSKYSSLS